MNKAKYELGPKAKAGLLIIMIVLGLAGLYVYNQYYNPLKNTPPEIVYFYPGRSPFITNQATYPFKYDKLIASVIDKDGDNLIVTFWINENISSPQWKGLTMFQGGNNTYICHLPTPYLPYPPRTRLMQWRVDVFDGHNVTSKVITF